MININYAEAINKTIITAMEKDSRILCFGIDAADPKKLGGRTKGMVEKFGKSSCFSTPLAEESNMGIAIGMSLAGLIPVNFHIRNDFLLCAANQIINLAAKQNYGTNGKSKLPLVIGSVVGKSWGQGYTHSQSFLSLFSSLSGLKVLAPTFPYDAAACYAWALQQTSPCLIFEHRLCYYQIGPVPENPEFKPYRILQRGADGTLIATSFMAIEALRAAQYLFLEHGLNFTVINIIDMSDMTWLQESFPCPYFICHNDYAESYLPYKWAHAIQNKSQDNDTPTILGWPFCPCPTTPSLEKEFYTDAIKIVQTVIRNKNWQPEHKLDIPEIAFKGPF